MKIQVLSDPHFEHHMDGGVGFIKAMPVAADILVIAGDLTGVDGLPGVLELVANPIGYPGEPSPWDPELVIEL